MFRKGKKVEKLDASEAKRTGGFEVLEVSHKRLLTTGEVDQALGRRVREGLQKRRVESFARRIDKDDIGSDERIDSLAGTARKELSAVLFFRRAGGEAEVQSGEAARAALVEPEFAHLRQ